MKKYLNNIYLVSGISFDEEEDYTMHSFVLTGFADEIDSDFQIQLQELKRLNIANIEIRGVNGRNITQHSLEEVVDLKNTLDSFGIAVSAIGSPIGKINIKEEYESHFDLFKHTVEIAKIMKTKYIRLFSFFMEHSEIEAYREEVMLRMRAFCDYVEGSDIILLHENEKDIFGDHASRCLELYQSMNSKNFKLIFDPANFVQCQEETYPYAFDLLKEHVVYYHIKDALKSDGTVVPSGYGDGQLKPIINELVQRNYKGFLSLEPHLGFFKGFSDLESTKVAPVFDAESDSDKFELATKSLLKIIEEVEDEHNR